MTDEELYQTLKLGRQLRVITTAHCENPELIAVLQQELVASGKQGQNFIMKAGLHWWRQRACII